MANKRISVNALQKAYKEAKYPDETFEWMGLQITVKKVIPLKDMLELVDDVVETCFVGNDGSYMPEVRDFRLRVCFLEKYTNLTMPKNITNQYELVYGSDLIDNVMARIDNQQCNVICRAIDDKITNLAQSKIEAANQKIEELCNSFEGLQTKLSEAFSNISEDDIKSVVTALSSGTIDEGKLVKAIAKEKGSKSKVIEMPKQGE